MLNAEWFKAETGMSGSSASLAKFDGSDLDDRKVVIRVPTSMPAGTGTLSVTNPWLPKFTACPFAVCQVSIAYSCEASGIAVRRP